MKVKIILIACFLAVTAVWFIFRNNEPSSNIQSVHKQKDELLSFKMDDKISSKDDTDEDKSQSSENTELFIKPLSDISVKERQKYYDNLFQQDALTLFNTLIELLFSGSTDTIRKGFISHALAYRLQHDKNTDHIYSKFYEFLSDSSHSAKAKTVLIRTLGRTATPGALEVLLKYAGQVSEPDLKSEIIQQISGIGEFQWDRRFHEELSPFLENAWIQESNDSRLTAALAKGLAEVGSPVGIEMLLSEIQNNVKTVDELKNQTDKRVVSALYSLDEIRNPNAIPVLSNGLRDQGIENVELFISGTALAAMGKPEATEVLLEWAQNARDEHEPLAKKWFSKVRDPKSVKLLKDIQNKPFKSQMVKDSVETAYEKIIKPFKKE